MRASRVLYKIAICLCVVILGACRQDIPATAQPLALHDSSAALQAALTTTPTILAETPAPTIEVEIPKEDEVPPSLMPAGDDPFAGLRIDDLSERKYGGSGIVIGDVIKVGSGFTQRRMTYPSDGLLITGLIDIPDGEGPFPVAIVNHGYLRRVDYQSGFDSWRMADWLAQHGYLALMSDYRNYAGSDTGPNPFHIGYAIDIMNLIAQADSLPNAAPGQIGLIGHSMGGEISMWPMVISKEVDAVVLYSSMSGDIGRNALHARKYWPAQRASIEALLMVYGMPDENPEAYAEASPVHYLDRVQVPVMIHHGTRDESVPYWWSEELWHQMQDAGIDVTFWPYPGGGHGLGGNGFQTLMERTLVFFDDYVRGDFSASAASIDAAK